MFKLRLDGMCPSINPTRSKLAYSVADKIILNFLKFVATKKGLTKNFFLTPLFCCCFWIRDPGSGMGKNQDPQH
jgi:hypothetical protein